MTLVSKALLVAVMSCLLVSGGAYADQIEMISADFLPSAFVNAGGDYSQGVLTVTGIADIVVDYASNPTVIYSDGGVLLTTSLFQDVSAGGIADGIFQNGSITLTDNALNTLLSANIISMEVAEQASIADLLVGDGWFVVTGGSLAADFGGAGEVFQLEFFVNPTGIQNFSQNFGGTSDVKLTPIPEPATLLLVGTFGLTALGWARRRMVR